MESKKTNSECKNISDNNNVHYGKIMANCSPEESVVITGIAGNLPSSRNVKEYADNLFNKVDMVKPSARWPEMENVPKRNGQIMDIDKFDNAFFGLPYWLTHGADPMMRLFLERAIEAIFDAGLNPKDLEGTNTGVFVGACNSETEPICTIYNKFTGSTRSMLPNRVSYFLKLKGPSYVVDSACSSSLYAVDHAYRAIRSGECDTAIVGGANLCLHPHLSFQFYSLGVLSLDGASKPFDASSNGYARSDAVCAIVLQKSKNAKRIYGKIVHVKSNCDGYKENGITFPSGEVQAQCLKECYEEANIHPNEISYIEAHGTGTVVGDPEEAKALDDVFCKARDKPLLIGSCKSNIGHSEAGSGLCSIIKCIIAFETGIIPPTLHYSKPRVGVKPLEEGRLKVVTENTLLPKGKSIIGVSSFGFGGANCHIILSRFEKEKVNNGVPKDNLPRLVCVSGRVPGAIPQLLNQVTEKIVFDAEFVRVLHEVFRYNIQGHLYRGFSIVSKNGEIYQSKKLFSEKRPQLFFEFSGFDNNWDRIGEQLLQLPLFAATVQKVYDILSLKNINIVEIFTQKRPKSLQEQILGNITVQLGLVDILKAINLKPNYVIGFGVNELVTAYQDGVLTLNQVLESAFIITSCLCDDPPMMSVYLVELTSDLVKGIVPTSVHVQSLSENRCIAYCPLNISDNFLNNIKSNGIQVRSLGEKIDYKSSIKKENLIKQLNNIITKPNQWTRTHLLCPNQMADSEYFVNSLINPFNFSNIQQQITTRSVVLEFGSTSLNFLIADKIVKEMNYMQTVIAEYSLISLLKCIGRLYEEGFNANIYKIYPEVQFPVSRTTPSLSSSIKWHHDKKWDITLISRAQASYLGERLFKVQIKHPNWNFLSGHNIDGRNLFPAAGYIRLVWQVLALLENKVPEHMKVVIENCRFIRATPIPKEGHFTLIVMIQKGTGNFEIIDGSVSVVKGRIQNIESSELETKFQQMHDYEREIKMSTKDIYKELRLRGYNYTGGFRAIKECNISATEGLIKWEDNWITFIDNMFQMKILQFDTRFLYVPTVITKLTINAKQHTNFIKSLSENPCVPVQVYQEADLIRSGGIFVKGLKANSIPRRKDLSDPVLEKHQFVANQNTTLTLEEALYVDVQLLLENVSTTNLKVVEVIDKETDPNTMPLAPIINQAVGDQPVVKAETIILSAKTEYENCDKITIENKPLGSQHECNLIVATKLLSRPIFLQEAFRALKENCYILSREPKNVDLINISKEVTILTTFFLENECLLLLSKLKRIDFYEVIDVSNKEHFSWVESIKRVKKDNNMIVLSQDDNINGILGLVNCLRRELNPDKIKCVFLMDNAPPFNINEQFYAKQLEKNMAINIYKNGQWGTYRHLLLKTETIENCDHSFVNTNSPGDLSSLTWVQGHLNRKKSSAPEKSLVNVYYSAINFRDVMTASGKINIDVITMNRLLQGCVQGFEFTGRLQNGQRVMGMAVGGALATLIEADNVFLWPIPTTWSMKNAATIPVCYSTVTWAMIQVGKMKKGDKVLIHSGTGGIGQAAIRLALYTGCTVFTTVGTPEKREFLKKQFPQLKDSNIASSRDLSFVSQILKETNGTGVDMVLNSLAEEKLLGSVHCLGQKGKFLEIGKFDLANNNPLKLELIKKNASFHGVMLDQFFNADPSIKLTINNIIKDLIKAGAIEPLNTNLFEAHEVENAFRFMGAGKHIGKVLVEVRKEEADDNNNTASNPIIKAIPRYYCEENNTSIIIGGLGGFGLELADWLILRGARKLILTSRKGIQNGYQAYRIKIWESYGVQILISTADITTEGGCLELLRQANELGTVEAIFNLAVVLKDAIIENQDAEAFKISFGPKAVATMYLDEISRKICPNLRTFVVFSSVSCGRGNAGQTNYGMANSVMERICEKRKQEGYPGLAIQWGAVGDVGLVADMQEEHKELEIGGTLQQKIFNCLKVMDNFLTQRNAAVVASMVVAEKRIGGSENMIEVIADILGIKDLKAISMHTSFPEIGMDSMSAVEIKQTLERDYEIFLTAEDIRGMNFAKLLEMQEKRLVGDDKGETATEIMGGFDFLLRLIGDEKLNNIPVLKLDSKLTDNIDIEPVLFFPGIEGVATVLNPLVQNLHVKAFGIQFGCVYEKDTIRELAEAMIPYITPELKTKSFKFVAYSFGVLFSLEIVSILESLGYKGTVICIDGSPQYLKQLTKIIDAGSDDKLQTSLICKMLSMRIKLEEVEKVKPSIMNCKSLDERVAFAQDFVDEKLKNDQIMSRSHLRQFIVSIYKRIKGAFNYRPSFSKIDSKVVLIKSKFISLQGLSPDYELSKVCGQNVDVIEIEANHVTILESPIVAKYINEELAGRETDHNIENKS